jgi:hypothetical protein
LLVVGEAEVESRQVGQEVPVLLIPGKIKSVLVFELIVNLRNDVVAQHFANRVSGSKISHNKGDEGYTDDHKDQTDEPLN